MLRREEFYFVHTERSRAVKIQRSTNQRHERWYYKVEAKNSFQPLDVSVKEKKSQYV